MKKYYLVMAFLMLIAALSATVLLTDNFTGTPQTLLTAPANGWIAHDVAGTNPLKIGNTGLTYAGYSGSGIGTATTPTGNGEDINKGFSAVNSGNVYYSFLINAPSSATTAGYPIHLCRTSGSLVADFYGKFFIQKNSETGLQFGVSKLSTAPTYTGFNYVTATTYLIIIRYTFNTGSTTDDVISLWVNPTLGGTEPTPTVSHTEAASQDVSALSSIAIRQFNVGTLATLDGIIVGTTWADVAGGSISAPTTQAFNLAFTNIAQTKMNVSWTNGNGAKRVVLMNTSNIFTAPADGTDPTADTSWNNSGQQVLYNGSGNSLTVTALSAATNYWYRAYEYNGSGTSTKYQTSIATNNPSSQQTTIPMVPTLSTTAISTVTTSTASSGGTISTDGGASITAKGVCWNTTGTPMIADSHTSDGSGTAAFPSSIASLAAGTMYYVRAYATNSVGTGYGNELSFTTLKAEPSNHVSNFAAGTTTSSTIPLSWADAAKVTPDGYLIKGSEVGFSSISDPVDGIAEANALLVGKVSQGTQIYEFTGLNPGTSYYFRIYPYTNSGTGIDYKTDGTIPQASGTTQTVTVLAPGDLAIIAFQVDTPDQFAFITFVPINAGTEIKFTDNGWTDTNTLYNNEGTITWTAPASKLAAGQIITITAGIHWNADKGTIATNGTPGFSADGDQLIAYQGYSTSPTLLYALSTLPWATSGAISSYTTYFPTGLVDGLTALDFSTEMDDQYYNVSPITGTPAQILASIASESNWTASDTRYVTLPAWEVGTLPVELSSFTALVNTQNMINIQWITQSESNLNGYYIQRSSSDQLSQAVLVSPLILATNTSQQQVYLYTDSELLDSGTYYYWLEVQELDGTMTYHGPRMVIYNAGGNPGTPHIPLLTELKSVYPNPFNPSATIQYALAKNAKVNLTIYNARGQIVRSFSEGDKTSGSYNVIWNGTDNFGRECGTGIYYIRMQAGAESFIQKAVLMK